MSDAPPPIPARAPTRKPRRGDLLEVAVEGLAAGGGLVGRARDASGDYRVELRRGVPGERVRAEVLARRGQDLRARSRELLEPSPHAVAPRCRHVPDCGGCAHQDLDYAAQLDEKRSVAERILGGHGLWGREGAPAVEACLPCPSPWRYRNKMDFTFASSRFVHANEPPDAERGFALGLHPAGVWGKVIDVDDCWITFPESRGLLKSARELARAQGLPPWDVATQSGLLRHLVLRRSFARGELLVNLVTSEPAPERVGPWAEALLARHPEVTTLVQTINSGLAKTAQGEEERVLSGPGFIVEELGGFEFRLSARSFFQTNTPQAERLLALVLEAAQAGPEDTVFDLYCGAGALSLALAARAGRVLGFELVDEAVADARANAARNGVANVELHAGDVAATLAAEGLPAPSVVVVDPPRGGLHPRVVEALGRSPARRLVYVSCNVKSAARDCARLRYRGLELVRVQPVDLFPHTPHLESVLTLARRP